MKRLPYATICVLCAVIGVLFALSLDEGEFSGGRVTGWLLSIHDLSTWLFVLSAVMTFLAPRTAAVFVAPGVFQALFQGDWKIQPAGLFQWDIRGALRSPC
ncbi:MAG TPA: hypothetical protein VFP91_01150 [Vicinamibacterales bacterium]|nr:hypothetical protein [Vicinamibacterales bacterium]